MNSYQQIFIPWSELIRFGLDYKKLQKMILSSHPENTYIRYHFYKVFLSYVENEYHSP